MKINRGSNLLDSSSRLVGRGLDANPNYDIECEQKLERFFAALVQLKPTDSSPVAAQLGRTGASTAFSMI